MNAVVALSAIFIAVAVLALVADRWTWLDRLADLIRGPLHPSDEVIDAARVAHGLAAFRAEQDSRRRQGGRP